MVSRTSTILTVTGITVVGGLLAYAAYFDFKRRNDVEFRKQLRKDKKRVDKSVAQQSKESLASSSSAPSAITPAVLREALEQIKNEPGPQSPEEKENYFMSQVGMGEQLAAQGSEFYLPAALSFYRALRVYPSPVELIVIYQKTVPEPIFKVVMDLTNLDARSRIEAYHDHFPPKWTNVSVKTHEVPGGTIRKVLVVNRDFAAGEEIYKEHPVVTALDWDLQAAGTYCAQCLRHIESKSESESDTSVQIPAADSPLTSTFCSEECLLTAKAHSHSLLFTLTSPLPAAIPSAPVTADALDARKVAQAKFAVYLQGQERTAPLLVSRFIARQVAAETAKMVNDASGIRGEATGKVDYTDADEGDYQLADHMERLRYLEVVPPQEQLPLLVDVLQTALPGLEQFVTDERHATLSGKMAYNAYGVCFDGGRDDRPEPAARPEEVEKTRTPHGTQRQIGSAIYTVSSYLNHSCTPSVRPSFSAGTAEIHILAERDLKEGDELTVAFVDVAQHAGESASECRRRRRKELARGWRFACGCVRCGEEGKELTVEEKAKDTEEAGDAQADGSKVEATLTRFENPEGGEQIA